MIKKDTSMKRVGNEEARPGKRAAFKEAKGERSELASSIHNAFAKRGGYAEETVSYWDKIPNVDGEFTPKSYKTDSEKVRRGRK